MVEAIVAHDALRLARAVGDAVDGVEVLLAALDPAFRRRVALDVGGTLGGLHLAVVWTRMAREHAVVQARLPAFFLRTLPLEFLAGLEHAEHVADGVGVVTRPHHVLEPEAVGFHLVLAAVAHHPGLRADVGELADRVGAGEDGRGHGAERGGNAARLAARRMARGDVADLVTDDAGELRLGVEVHQQAAVHIDIAATGDERVDVLVVEHEEPELLVGQVARGHEALADDVHVLLHGLVVVDTKGLDDFLVVLLDGLLFTLPGTEHHVLAASGRVGGTADEHSAGRREGERN
jgi:hypothetical protein